MNHVELSIELTEVMTSSVGREIIPVISNHADRTHIPSDIMERRGASKEH